MRLGDVAPIAQAPYIQETDKVWLLNLDMVEAESGNILDYLYVDPESVGMSTCKFNTENVLYSKLRPYLNKVVLPAQEGYATSEMLPLKPNRNLLMREYLTYYLRSPSFVSYISERVAGAKMPRARTEDLLNAEIPLPDIMVQRQITDILDKVTDLISLRKKQIAKLDELIKARFVEMMDSSELGEETTLEAITERVKVGFVGTCEKFYTDESGIPMLRTGNITDNGIDMTDVKYVTEEFHEKNMKSQIHSGDLLIARHGSNGQANVYDGPEAQCLNAVVIVPNPSIARSVFLAGIINSPDVKAQINKTLVGSTQHVVNTKSIANLIVRIPNLEIQKQYEEFATQVDKSKWSAQKGLNQLETLKKALMQKYFG